MLSNLQLVWVCVSLRTYRVCSTAIFHSRLKRIEKLCDTSEVKYTCKRRGSPGHRTRLMHMANSMTRTRWCCRKCVWSICVCVWCCVAHAWHRARLDVSPMHQMNPKLWFTAGSRHPLNLMESASVQPYAALIFYSPNFARPTSPLALPLNSLKQWLPFIVLRGTGNPLHPKRKSVLPPHQSSCTLSTAPSTFLPPFFYPFWNHIFSLPLQRIAASLFLPSSPSFPLMRIHNLSPVAWTPIPQCGCLIGFGCGCTSGTELQVVSSWPRAAWAVLDPEGWEWAE